MSLAQCDRYLEAFRRGEDPHAVTSAMLYGATWQNASDADKKRMREFSKRFVYACVFGSGDDTVHDTIASVEDEAGNLVYANVSMRETSELRRRWISQADGIESWWKHQTDTARKQGFLIEPIFGRRRDFIDDDAYNEALNFVPQSSGAALIHLATLDFLQKYPFRYAGPGTGLVCQIHDALLVECPYADVKRVSSALQECFTRSHPGLPGVSFSGNTKVGNNWAEV
jgi:DNA polymerase-1